MFQGSEDSFTRAIQFGSDLARKIGFAFPVKNVTCLAINVLIFTGIDWLARSKIIRKQTSKSSIQ